MTFKKKYVVFTSFSESLIAMNPLDVVKIHDEPIQCEKQIEEFINSWHNESAKKWIYEIREVLIYEG